MIDPAHTDPVPLSHLPTEEKATRASSFGGVASHYERFRPGPPMAAVDWLLPSRVGRVVDLGAGTGALTRLLVDRADDVVAVEPDERIREVLAEEVRGVRVLEGRGESMPLADGTADAVLASSSWHWVEVVPGLAEMRRVLVPGGTLGTIWSGPDPTAPFVAQARALLAERPTDDADQSDERESLRGMASDLDRPTPTLEIPDGTGFSAPEHHVVTWDVPLNADDLIGLLGTFSWIITMDEDRRTRVLAEARRLLAEVLGVEGDMTVDIAFRADVWRARRET